MWFIYTENKWWKWSKVSKNGTKKKHAFYYKEHLLNVDYYTIITVTIAMLEISFLILYKVKHSIWEEICILSILIMHDLRKKYSDNFDNKNKPAFSLGNFLYSADYIDM